MLQRFAGIVSLSLFFVMSVAGEERPSGPGATEKGFVLPNGWTITPAGRQVIVTDLPLNILPLADGKHALIATSGYNKHELSLVDLAEGKVVDRQTVRQSWYGLAASPDNKQLWWSGGGAGMLHVYNFDSGKLIRTGPDEPPLSKKNANTQPAKTNEKITKAEEQKKTSFKSGLFHDSDAHSLYSLDINLGTLTVFDTKDSAKGRTLKCGGRPYDVVRGRNGAQLFVSDWSRRQVMVIDSSSLRLVGRIAVGEHPNQMAVHPKDDRLFVACASSNWVSVIDTRRGVVSETIATSLFPRAPEGSTPDALALAPDGETLYVANADNNCVAVIDVSAPGKSQVKGFIPTGWYPTSVAVTPDGKTLLVGVGKGNQTRPNPIRKDAKEDKNGRRPFPYIGTTLSGALSIVPVPDEKQLAEYTATVYRNCPYSDKLLTATPNPGPSAIPAKVGDPSPIQYVIYIIKENRTYDQVFGDMKEGNGDPSLVMFGEEVTPNHHKLAREFVLLDNLYCNGQVSRDGHPWSTMAYNTDYIARDWHLTYSSRKGVDDDDEGRLSNAPSGYLWDACNRAGLSYRSYGEYGKRVSTGAGANKMEARVPGLVGHICPDYGISKIKGKRPRDTDNVEVFLKEYHEFEKTGQMPRFIVMSLGEDHTTGTTPDTFTPRACVASNDLALGRLVEAVTQSKYWKETAIFVIEDDAQNGPDHVDAHRTVGLVISPYTKRHAVDSTQYSTVSLVRTIELILGLPPLSQYDAAARPMYASFTDKADLTGYTYEKPRIDLNTVNTKKSYGATRSSRMDFSDYDLVDDFELNEILWRSIKGEDAPVPATVRRAIANRPAEAPKKATSDSLADDARTVLAAVVKAAADNQRLPERGRRTGDDLTVYYVRAAATAARRLPNERAAPAFLLALGIALDDSSLLRTNLMTRTLWQRTESDESRKRRLRVLGSPALHGRHDLAQHFSVSAALTAAMGEQAAESAGLLKEMLDSRGGSGFSFADLSADFAGIAFARRLLDKPERLADVEKSFAVADYALSPKGLTEGLTADEFAKRYGSLKDERFLRAVADLRKRIDALPGYSASDTKQGNRPDGKSAKEKRRE